MMKNDECFSKQKKNLDLQSDPELLAPWSFKIKVWGNYFVVNCGLSAGVITVEFNFYKAINFTVYLFIVCLEKIILNKVSILLIFTIIVW